MSARADSLRKWLIAGPPLVFLTLFFLAPALIMVIASFRYPGVFAGSALVFIPVLGMFAIPEILGGKDDWLVGNMIKEAFLGVRDWPFGSMLSIMLTVAVLAVAGCATWVAGRFAGRTDHA